MNDLEDPSNINGKEFKIAKKKVTHLGTNNKNLCYKLGSLSVENYRGGGKLVYAGQSQEIWMCCVYETGKEGYIC